MGNQQSTKKKRIKTKKLSEDGITQLSKETQYDRAKIIELQKGFLQRYPTGLISKHAFIDEYQRHPSFNRRRECNQYLENLFRAFDRDQSGEIDFVEYLIAMSIEENGTVEDKLRLIFKQFDADNSGKIDLREMEIMIKAIYEMDPSKKGSTRQDYVKKAQDIMSKLDKNKDSSVAIEEFVRGCLEDESLKRFLIPVFGL